MKIEKPTRRPPLERRLQMIIVVLAVCFSTVLPANTPDNDSASPQISTPANKAPTNVPEGTVRDRGQLLYENHCTVYHDSSVSIREHRKVRSLTDIRFGYITGRDTSISNGPRQKSMT